MSCTHFLFVFQLKIKEQTDFEKYAIYFEHLCRQPKRKLHEPQIAKFIKKSPAQKSSIVEIENSKLPPKKFEMSEEETRKCCMNCNHGKKRKEPTILF